MPMQQRIRYASQWEWWRMLLLGRRVAEEPLRLRDEPARQQGHDDADEDERLEDVADEHSRAAEQTPA